MPVTPRISGGDRSDPDKLREELRDSLYKALVGSLLEDVDTAAACGERLRARLSREGSPIVFFRKVRSDQDPKDLAFTLAVWRQAWENLIGHIEPIVRHYLLVTLECSAEPRGIWTRWRAPKYLDHFENAYRKALEDAGLGALNLPGLRSPTKANFRSWVDECVDRFHPSAGEAILAEGWPDERCEAIPHRDLRPHDRVS